MPKTVKTLRVEMHTHQGMYYMHTLTCMHSSSTLTQTFINMQVYKHTQVVYMSLTFSNSASPQTVIHLFSNILFFIQKQAFAIELSIHEAHHKQ